MQHRMKILWNIYSKKCLILLFYLFIAYDRILLNSAHFANENNSNKLILSGKAVWKFNKNNFLKVAAGVFHWNSVIFLFHSEHFCNLQYWPILWSSIPSFRFLLSPITCKLINTGIWNLEKKKSICYVVMNWILHFSGFRNILLMNND